METVLEHWAGALEWRRYWPWTGALEWRRYWSTGIQRACPRMLIVTRVTKYLENTKFLCNLLTIQMIEVYMRKEGDCDEWA